MNIENQDLWAFARTSQQKGACILGMGFGVKLTTLFHPVIGVYMVLPHILLLAYPLVNSHITMENHTFSWENSLFLWPCSIAFCMFTRLGVWFLDFALGNISCAPASWPSSDPCGRFPSHPSTS